MDGLFAMEEFDRLLGRYRRAVVDQSHGYPVGAGPGAWSEPAELDASVSATTNELREHVRAIHLNPR